jgi:hypothetical protein
MYESYQAFIKTCLQDETIFQNFKVVPYYREILEHVSYNLGIEYLIHIWNEFRLDTPAVAEYCTKNDRVGNPVLFEYAPNIKWSATSIRYIHHALLILKHMKKVGVDNVDVVEVGCGYGGLCLAIEHFSKHMGITIKSYTLIDLDEPNALQEKYLSQHSLQFPCSFLSASNYGKEITGTEHFLISNYCFSEIASSHQSNYREVLFPKCSHGFFVWNGIPYYDIGKKVEIEEERPQTDMVRKTNKFVTF